MIKNKFNFGEKTREAESSEIMGGETLINVFLARFDILNQRLGLVVHFDCSCNFRQEHCSFGFIFLRSECLHRLDFRSLDLLPVVDFGSSPATGDLLELCELLLEFGIVLCQFVGKLLYGRFI